MWPVFPAADYYESSANPPIIGATFPSHLNGPSPVHMPDSNALVRLPVAVFILAFRKSMQTPRASYALHAVLKLPSYMYGSSSQSDAYMSSACIRIPPVKSCRWRRHFSPQTRINRFVFLNLPMLSLETHLGVTTSPHAPFPTGYVTLSMCNRSPPLRLSLAHSSERASDNFLLCYPLAFQKCSSPGNVMQTPPEAGRTVGEVGKP